MRDEEVPQHHKKSVKRSKPFGIQYSYGSTFGPRAYTQWYKTRKARDQAFVDLPKHECNILKAHGVVKHYRKVER